jgi:hypothetical protein
MLWVSGLSILCFFLPLALRPRAAPDSSPLRRVAALGYFAAIGAGFMLLETSLLHRFILFLGHPSYAAAVVLGSLLLGMGVGSELSPRLGVAGLRRIGAPLVLALLVFLLALPAGLSLGTPLPLGARALLSALCLLPVGAAAGLFFPLGMLRFGDALKPWYWAVNGAFGVMASVMSLALSMELGFRIVGGLAALVYLVAWLCLRRPQAPG